jgi:hypothetical protein
MNKYVKLVEETLEEAKTISYDEAMTKLDHMWKSDKFMNDDVRNMWVYAKGTKSSIKNKMDKKRVQFAYSKFNNIYMKLKDSDVTGVLGSIYKDVTKGFETYNSK